MESDIEKNITDVSSVAKKTLSTHQPVKTRKDYLPLDSELFVRYQIQNPKTDVPIWESQIADLLVLHLYRKPQGPLESKTMD